MLKHDFRPLLTSSESRQYSTLPRAETRPLRPSQRSVMERAASIDAARSPEAALSPPKDPARAQAVERLLIDVIRGKQDAASLRGSGGLTHPIAWPSALELSEPAAHDRSRSGTGAARFVARARYAPAREHGGEPAR